MTLYCKWFDTHNEYEAYKNGQDYLTPNISYCVDFNDVHFNKYIRNYSKEYLTTEAIENGTISFNIWKSIGTEYITSISYSTDNGETWATTNNTNNKSEHLTITVNVNEGDRILWKGDAKQLSYGDYEAGSFFSSTAKFNVYGNIMSLLYGDNFYDKTALEYECQFQRLFSDFDTVKNKCYVVNAENLSLPATTLADNCYMGMFYNCDTLTTAPELPATTLADDCYAAMFFKCSSLTTVPKLPATTLKNNCYSFMFARCSSLTTAPELPATTLKNECYKSMFNYCSKLNYIKAMFTTTPSSSYTSDWVKGISSSGTFVKNSAATWDVTGNNGIPEGWTVETANA